MECPRGPSGPQHPAFTNLKIGAKNFPRPTICVGAPACTSEKMMLHVHRILYLIWSVLQTFSLNHLNDLDPIISQVSTIANSVMCITELLSNCSDCIRLLCAQSLGPSANI